MITLSPEELAARKRRNLWIALGLVAFIVLVSTTTVLRLHQNQDDAAATAERMRAQEAAGTSFSPPSGAPPQSVAARPETQR